MKHIVPIACDSRGGLGGLGDEALQFIRRVYAKSSPDGPIRQWPSESMRTNLRNKLLDELSCLLARHRALDYIYMGVPDENRCDGFQPSPTSSLTHKKRKGHKTNKIRQNNNRPLVNNINNATNGNNTHANNSSNCVNNNNNNSSSSSSRFFNIPALVLPSLHNCVI